MSTELRKLRAFVGRHRISLILRRIRGQSGVVLGAGLTVASALQILFVFVPWTILVLMWNITVATCAAGLVVVIARNALWNVPSIISVAGLVEQKSNVRHSLLRAALELAGDERSGSDELRRETVRHAHQVLAHLPAPPLEKTRSFRTAFLIASIALFGGLSYFGQPRLLSYWKLPFDSVDTRSVRIIPGTVKIPFSSSLELRCSIPGRITPSCGIVISDLSGTRQIRRILRPDSSGAFVFPLDSLSSSMAYSFTLGSETINRDTIRVVPRPSVYSLKIRVTPPVYTGQQQRELPEGQGSFSAFAGSRAHFHVRSVHGLREGRLLIGNGDSVALSARDGVLEGTMVVRQSGEYTFELIDSLGQEGANLPRYYVGLLEDHAPVVEFIRPAANVNLQPAQTESLWIEAADDIGVRSIALQYFKKTQLGADSMQTWDLSPRSPQTLLRKELVWNMSGLSLYPGDTLFYWARARDSKPWGVPQVAYTDTFWFRIPSFAEIHAGITGENRHAEDNLSDVLSRQDELEQKIEDIVRSSKGNRGELTWQEKEVVKDLSNEIQSQQDSLQAAMASLQKAVERLRDEGGATEEIAQKMEEVRKAVEELVENYGDSLLFSPPEEDQQVGWEEMREGLQKLEQMLPEMQERLENALAYLQALKDDQELAMLAAEAESLAREQRELAAEESSSEQRQKDLMAREEDFFSSIDEHFDNRPDSLFGDKRPDELERARKLQSQMQQKLDGNEAPSPGEMNQMSASLASLSEELRSMMSTGMAQRMQKERDMLLDMARDAMMLSDWQEEVKETAEIGRSRRNEELQNQAIRSQEALRQGLRRSRAKMDSLAMVPPQLLQELSRHYTQAEKSATQAVEELSRSGSGVPMGQSGQRLQGLAHSLLGAGAEMENMTQGGQGGAAGSMMSGLRKLSAKQGAINSATSEMLKMMMQGEGKQGMSGEGGEKARAAARQAQQAVADKLNELAEKYGSGENGGLGKRVEELEEEARRLARMLEQPTREVTDRQERFLVRLLQSTLATRKQGQGKEERKSRSAQERYSSDISGDKSALRGSIDRFHRLRLEAFGGNFPEEYRGAVEAYFDSLGVQLFGQK